MSVRSELADAGVGVVAGLEEEYSAEHLLIELSLLATLYTRFVDCRVVDS